MVEEINMEMHEVKKAVGHNSGLRGHHSQCVLVVEMAKYIPIGETTPYCLSIERIIVRRDVWRCPVALVTEIAAMHAEEASKPKQTRPEDIKINLPYQRRELHRL
jgi:hypothetical protein